MGDPSNMTDYASFADFMEKLINPMRQASPRHERLDGLISGGNRRIVGRFWHRGRRWKVHADTHYEPLMLAHRAISSRLVADPFEEQQTRVAGKACLVLVPELMRRLPRGPKHLYIYEASRAR